MLIQTANYDLKILNPLLIPITLHFRDNGHENTVPVQNRQMPRHGVPVCFHREQHFLLNLHT